MSYTPSKERYGTMIYNRCGNSGLLLPAISFGLWHNFGDVDSMDTAKKMIFTAFDQGITHFDLANNYGPPPGSAETNFGKIFKSHLTAYRDELIISSKAGHPMWPGPYGDGGSRKYLHASLDQSLKRMNLDYVDIFYSHRPDPNTPLEETMTALAAILKDLGVPLLIHQVKYHMFARDIEHDNLLDALEITGSGCICFCPLAQGMLTDKYLKGIPATSRANKSHGFLQKDALTADVIAKINTLNKMAQKRRQSLAEMALAWVLRDKRMTSALIGASTPEQIIQNVRTLSAPELEPDEQQAIDTILMH